MSDKREIDESIDFVSSHYDGSLLPKEGWSRFSGTHRVSWLQRNAAAAWLRRNAAAACIGAAVLVASAAAVLYISTSEKPIEPQASETTTLSNPSTPAYEPYKIVKIQFADAPLSEVVAEIEKVYGVKITNIPTEETRLTISYEGNVYDVIETINELLGTNLTIEENEQPTEAK